MTRKNFSSSSAQHPRNFFSYLLVHSVISLFGNSSHSAHLTVAVFFSLVPFEEYLFFVPKDAVTTQFKNSCSKIKRCRNHSVIKIINQL